MNRLLRPGPPAGSTEWVTYPTPHFVLYYVRRSAAENSLRLVASRLEKLRAQLVGALGLGDTPGPALPVYLAETLEDVELLEDERAEASGPEGPAPALFTVYRLDAPGGELDRQLVALLLVEAWGRHAAPALLIDGLLGYLTQLDRNEDRGRLNAALAELERQGQPVGLALLLAGPDGATKVAYYQAATSFVGYLLDTHGPEPFRRFAERLAEETAALAPGGDGVAFALRGGGAEGGAEGGVPGLPALNAASEAAYGRPVAVLEQAWLRGLRDAQATFMGLAEFLRRSSKYLRPHWRWVLGVFACLMVALAFETYVPLNYKVIIDGAVKKGDASLLVVPLVGLFVFFIIYGIGNVLKQYLAVELGHNIMNRIQLQMFDRLERLSLGYFAHARAGDLVSRFATDVVLIEEALVKSLPVGFSIVVGLVVTIVIIFLLDWRMAAVALAALGLFALVPRFTQRRVNRASYESHHARAEIAAVVSETVVAQPVVKAFGLQEQRRTRFQHALDHLVHADARLTFLSSLVGLGATLSNSFVVVASLALGAYLVIVGEIELGTLVAFIGLLKNIEKPIKEVGNVLQSVQKATGGLQRVDELLGERPQVEDAPGAKPMPRPRREIRFEDVVFSYTGEQVNLSRLSFCVPYGQSIAIVGPSGCGKSTVLNLLMRYYDPAGGAVKIDGEDLRRFTQESVRAQIGAVLQENFLFNASVRENIRMGRPEASDGEVEAAAKAAEVHDLVAAMPQGYDTFVGERGGRLSAGLRQRIAIARALLRDPAILLLDEATSALDPHSEAAVNATLMQVARGRTLLYVTHRLAAAKDFGRILVLDHGELVEEGSHEELLQREGAYFQMWARQTGALREDVLDAAAIAERLRAIPMFKNLEADVLLEFAGHVVLEQFEEGVTVFEEGDAGEKLYLIARGQVEVARTGPTGEEQLLAVLRDGDYFGEVGFYREVRRPATVRTRADCLFLTLDRKEILKNVADTLSLPDATRHLANWIRRRREVTPAEVAAFLGQPEEEALVSLGTLVAEGFLQEVEREGMIHYRPRLASKRGRHPAPDLMKSLTEKL
jgi:ATP-binding cassette subfamily B protein